ncbi:hypothetical protein A2U01_0092801, partial [Trifolium medium]|nr:hypothetical protein [Trifolium medium]
DESDEDGEDGSDERSESGEAEGLEVVKVEKEKNCSICFENFNFNVGVPIVELVRKRLEEKEIES